MEKTAGLMRTRTWISIAAATLVGGAGLAVAGHAAWQADLNHQPHVTDSISAMDTAVAAALAAAGDRAALAVSSMVRSTTCDVGALHHRGGEYTRAAEFFTDPGTDSDLLGRIAARLSAEYVIHHASLSTTLDADVGHGVHLQVSRLGEGWLTVDAGTGCVIGPAATEMSSSSLTATALNTIHTLLSHLDATAAETHVAAVRCSQGGMSTAVTISRPMNTSDLQRRLAPWLPPGAHVYATTSNRIAYRDGNASVIIAASDDATQVAIRYTQPC